MDAWISAADAAKLYDVTRRTVLRWAREDHWQHRNGRPVRYRWEDAQASYEKRHVHRLRNRLLQRHWN